MKAAALPPTASLMHRVLEALVLSSVPLTVRDIARRVEPWTATPYRTAAERRAVLDARDEHRAKARKRVSKALNHLASRGYVAAASDPTLTTEAMSAWQRDGRGAFRPRRYEVRGGYIVGVADDEPEADAMVARIVEVLADVGGSAPYAVLLEMTGGSTPSGRESGAFRRAMGWLVGNGWVISGRARSASEVGRARYLEMVAESGRMGAE